MLYASSLPRILKRGAHSVAKDVLYIDRGTLVVNKPAGLVCQFNRRSNDASRERGSTDSVTQQSDELELSEGLQLLVDGMPPHNFGVRHYQRCAAQISNRSFSLQVTCVRYTVLTRSVVVHDSKA